MTDQELHDREFYGSAKGMTPAQGEAIARIASRFDYQHVELTFTNERGSESPKVNCYGWKQGLSDPEGFYIAPDGSQL